MTDRRWEQITGIAGIASVALLFGQLATWANPHFNDPLRTITAYYVRNRNTALASIDLWMVGVVCMLILAAGLRSILRKGEGNADILSTVSFGAAVAMVCIGTAFNAMNGALGLFAPQASPSEIRLLMALSNAADNFQFMPVAIFVGAASFAIVGTRTFPRWIGWVGVCAGVLLMLGSMNVMDVNAGIGDLGMLGLLLFAVWTLAIGTTLLRHPVGMAEARDPATRADRVPA